MESFTAIPGGGIAARVDGHDVLIGTRRLLEAHLEGTNSSILEPALEDAGKTAMLVVVDGTVVGALGVADTVKIGSAEAIVQAQREGMEVWMITGDNRRTALSVAAQVDIPAERVLAEVLPGAKTAQVEFLRKQGNAAWPPLFAANTKQEFCRNHQAMRSLKLAHCLSHLPQEMLLLLLAELSYHPSGQPAGCGVQERIE